MSPRTAFFLHIPKTGGTSLRKMLQRRIARASMLEIYDWHAEQDLLGADRTEVEAHRLVAGHFRIDAWLPFDNLPLITMLREPVDRVMSHYRYGRSWDHARFHDEACTMSLGEFALADLDRSLNNCQTHCLCTATAPLHSDELRSSPPFGGLATRDADEAVGYLERPNVLPGLSEAFAESVALTCVWLEIEPPPLEAANRSIDRTGDALDRSERSAIAAKNALDVRLYDAACDAFWDKWRAAGDDARRALHRIRQRPTLAPRIRSWQEVRLRSARQHMRRLVARRRPSGEVT
jgi:hypothetical protein